MFDADQYKALYERILGPNSETVTLHVNNGTGFDTYQAKAHVSNYRAQDLVEGGSIKLGDLRLIIDADTVPDGLRRLEAKDRIEVRGRVYGVEYWDDMSRSVGSTVIAYEAAVRG